MPESTGRRYWMGSSDGELIPELARHGRQQLIELELAAFLGADSHECTEELSGTRSGLLD
ncbi:MAG: hypothetical protein WBN89_15915 [Prochlorococcaceae cyanobacterium]